MRGHDLRRRRVDLGVSVEGLAQSAEMEPGTIEQWESFDLRLQKEDAQRVRIALWMIAYEQVMESSGLPACEWAERHASSTTPPDAEAWQEHLGHCELCQARDQYGRKHGPRMPGSIGWIVEIGNVVQRLPAPLASAVYGFFVVLMLTGIPILFLLCSGVLSGDAERLAVAGALLLVTTVGGGAGGITHYLTRSIRRAGKAGYYASWILVMYGYGAATLALIAWLEARFPTVLGEDSGVGELVREPLGLIVMLVVGAVFGVALGRGARESDAVREPAATEEIGPVRRGIRNAGKVGLAVLLVFAVGMQWWGGRMEQESIGSVAPTPAEAAERLPALEEAARARADDPSAQYDLGMALASLNRHEEALRPLRRAVELVPRNPSFQNAYGWSLASVGGLEEAAGAFERAAKLDPTYRTAWINLGHALADLGRLGEATSATERAVKLDEEDPWGHGMLARLYVEQRRFDEGRVAAEKALALQPDAAPHHETRARALLGLGRMDEALAEYRDAARLAPEQMWYWRELGRMAHMSGRYGEADRAFAEVHRLSPEHFAQRTEDRGLWDEARRLAGTAEDAEGSSRE